MKITEIYIKAFGKLRGIKISPIDGVNIIYGENEAGKSTVMAFILSMFYGIGKGEQRHRYDPWDGGRMSGIIVFEHDGKSYSLNRQFGATKAADKTELWCTTSGEQLVIPERLQPGEYVLGLNRETFSNSVYIGQAGVPIQGDNNEILAKLTNLAASGDETASRTEISERLGEASAKLRSRRAGAIIPGLEKQRLDLLEERSTISKRVTEADTLRDDVVRLTHRRDRLSGELETLEKRSAVITDIRKLGEMDDLIAQKKSLEQTRAKYTALHDAMFSDDAGVSREFLDDARGLLEEYSNRQAVIRVKQEHLSGCDDKLASIDRSPLKKMRVVKKYADRISEAFDEYNDLVEHRTAVERELEQEKKPTEGKFSIQNIIIIAAALVVLLVLLGFWKPIFWVFAGLVLIVTAAYVYVQKRGVGFEGLPRENIQLQNINADIRELNRSMRRILDEMDVGTMDELDRELHYMETTHARLSELEREREAIIEELAQSREELAETLQKLKDKLYPYKAVESDTEAVKIISALDKAQCDHAALEAKYNAEQEAFDAQLGERDYELVVLEAEELREKLGGSAKSSAGQSDDDLTQAIEKCQSELEDVRTELLRKEASLEAQNSDPQDLSKLNDEVKLLSSRIERYEFEYDALQEAQSALDDAFESMQKDFGPMINFRAGKIVESLTGGKYGSVIISESLTPSIAEPGGSIRSSVNLSAGTVDQIYLALRLAIAGILSEENLPLLLDDAFCQFDDKRMTDALYYLGKENGTGRLGQIILFTCHDRVLYAAKEVGLTDGVVRLK